MKNFYLNIINCIISFTFCLVMSLVLYCHFLISNPRASIGSKGMDIDAIILIPQNGQSLPTSSA